MFEQECDDRVLCLVEKNERNVGAKEARALEASARRRVLLQEETEREDSGGRSGYLISPAEAGSGVRGGSGDAGGGEEQPPREESDFGPEVGGVATDVLGDKELSEALLPEGDAETEDPDAPMSVPVSGQLHVWPAREMDAIDFSLSVTRCRNEISGRVCASFWAIGCSCSGRL